MGDKGVLSDLYLFKQLDEAIRREASGEYEKPVQSPLDDKRKRVVVVKKERSSPDVTLLPGIIKHNHSHFFSYYY